MRVTAYTSEAKVIVECSQSGAEQLQKLLDYIKSTGGIGHSFHIVVDPEDSEFKNTFGWDGDGADSIEKITVINSEENKE